MDLFIIKLALPRTLSLLRAFLKPGISALVMGGAAWAVYGLATRFVLDKETFLGNAVATVLAIGVAVIVYFVLILVTKAISKDDLALMPKGEKIARLLRVK